MVWLLEIIISGYVDVKDYVYESVCPRAFFLRLYVGDYEIACMSICVFEYMSM